MDCQSGCPLKALITPIFEEPTCIRHALPRALPPSGQRWKDRKKHATKIPGIHEKMPVILVWPNECNLQRVHARVSHGTESEVER